MDTSLGSPGKTWLFVERTYSSSRGFQGDEGSGGLSRCGLGGPDLSSLSGSYSIRGGRDWSVWPSSPQRTL